MCGINAIINNKNGKYRVQDMHNATKHRGTRLISQVRHKAEVAFNWLQITDQTLNEFPNEHNGTVVYMNGYISNFYELALKHRIELETNCDIELLAKFLDKFNGNNLNELNGFFAVLYWSPFYNDWFLFTDRYGIKQLYKYTNAEGVTFISSEPKGILAVCPEIQYSQSGVEDWKCTLGVMNSDTIYQGIHRVGKLPFFIPEKIDISYDEAKFKLAMLLEQSFNRNEYNGDSGVYLSGGVDSGLIAKWMQPEYSFSVDYVESMYSEGDLIKLNSVGNHYSIIVNPEFAMEYAAKTLNALDDLKAGSCYTNFAIAELASKFVKVMFSGAGGDEFFGGYPHRKNKHIHNVIARTDHALTVIDIPENWDISHFEYDFKFLSSILVVEDRMSAFHTMETRYPLLDNDLVNFALSLPDEYLENKRILKDVSELHPDVIDGRKKGFSNPYFTNDGWVNYTLQNLDL